MIFFVFSLLWDNFVLNHLRVRYAKDLPRERDSLLLSEEDSLSTIRPTVWLMAHQVCGLARGWVEPLYASQSVSP